ncbi:MAG: dimethylarginine dimethylaminohydrolase family protein [Flavobacteriales bacterium]
MIQLHVTDEVSRLRAVVLGRADSQGKKPKLQDTYDPKSAETIKKGIYPIEPAMVREIETLNEVFVKYGVTVYRPEQIENYNQIFARDIAFVIEDKLIKANILPDRDKEIQAIEYIWQQVPKENRITFPEEAHIEGGDVMPWNDYIFVGTYREDDYENIITARTNMKAVKLLQELFPNKKVKSFNLKKSVGFIPKDSNKNTVEELHNFAINNALHLDCCFQPLGMGKAIIHKDGFLIEDEYQWLLNFFGKENVFEITKEEMYQMNSNVFSIAPNVVVSEKNFTRLNTWLRSQGFTVEEIPYAQIAKQEGLLRCSTMPLLRD